MKHTLSVLLQNKPGALSRVNGSASKIEALIDILRPIGIKKIVRTGKIAISRSKARKSS